MVLRGLRSTIKVKGAAGFVGGRKKRSPFIVMNPDGGSLGPGGSVAMVLQFSGKPNPFTPDVLVFDQSGVLQRTLGKPTNATTDTGGTNVFQPHGPAVDIAFEKGVRGGRLFATGFTAVGMLALDMWRRNAGGMSRRSP